MVRPKVIRSNVIQDIAGYKGVEFWRLRGKHFQVVSLSDGYVEVRMCDKDGNKADTLPLIGWSEYKDREAAIKWLNDNIQ